MREEIRARARPPGFIEAELKHEFPGLRLDWISVQGGLRDSPPEVRERLRMLSNRYRGANVVAMRTQPIPHAYRAFFRQIGLDPDTTRIPSERRQSRGCSTATSARATCVGDALLIALVETGVPVWALDGDLVDVGGLGIRTTVEGDRLGTTEYGNYLPPGRLASPTPTPCMRCCSETSRPATRCAARTKRAVLFSVGVDGVPAIHVEEALWLCAEVLGAV